MTIKHLTTERLAELIFTALDIDDWGDVDPHLIEMVADGCYDEDDEHHDEAEAMRTVLDRVVAKLKQDYG